jgi:hypothetical protein
MNTKLAQFEKLIKNLLANIESDPFLNPADKTVAQKFVMQIGADVKAGQTQGIEMRLCMVRNSIREWRKEALFA